MPSFTFPQPFITNNPAGQGKTESKLTATEQKEGAHFPLSFHSSVTPIASLTVA